MNKVEERVDGFYRETIHGHEDRDRAVEQMVLLCGEYIRELQKEGLRCTIDAGNWDGRLVFRVIGKKGVVLKHYSIKK